MKNRITEKIVRLAAPYTAVAFDVFDTLIKRDVAKPTDLFALHGKAFADSRVEAEALARSSATRKEVTLADIYAQPMLAGSDPAEECTWELQAIVANEPVREAVRILRAQNKNVYFVSDMYLPPEQISAMLTRCGYDSFAGGFVSSSYGVQKRSGALFRRFLHETGFKAGQVLFIGDSWRADVIGAALAGIRSWHLPEPAPVPHTPSADTLVGGALRAFLENRTEKSSCREEALGFSVLGPLQVGFCQWLHDRRQSRPEGRLFFLARDMYLIREVYKLLYPEETTFYLQVSRRSLCPVLLAKGQYSLLLSALPRQRLTGEQIAEYCDALCPREWEQAVFDLKSAPVPEVQEFLQGLKPSQSGRLALEYLQRMGMHSGDLLVDIGSGGTTQVLLEELCGITLHGFQMSGDERLRERFHEERTEVFLSLDKEQGAYYWAAQPMLERLISQDVGATEGYDLVDEEIRVRVSEQHPSPVIEKLQQGALAFAEQWQQSVLKELRVPADLAIKPFLDLFRKPDGEEVAMLGQLEVEDGGVYPLAAPKSLYQYFQAPQELADDFFRSRWKIGFMKGLLRVSLPYDRLYQKMKR